jgi:UDPglucose 6-dehydrogenase
LATLLERGAIIRAHDPQAMTEAARLLPDVKYCSSAYEACEQADAVVLITEWNEYRALDLQRIKSLMKQAVFVDLRNVYVPAAMKQLGFCYYSVGRATTDKARP